MRRRIGAALGLGPHEIGFENHRVSLWSAGVPYVTVPVASLDVAAGDRLTTTPGWSSRRRKAGHRRLGLCLLPRGAEPRQQFPRAHVRRATPTYEDPATDRPPRRSPARPHFDKPVDGCDRDWIEQGIEMGRPSRIRLEIDVESGAMTGGRIGGHAVRVAEGVLFA